MKGPSRKEESQQKSVVIRHDYSKDISLKNSSKCKNANSNNAPSVPTTYDEAKASCKARKRKERQESISSLCQERKVIRSNSEERPAQKKYFEKQTNIRRVSSSEDFQKSETNNRQITLTLSSERLLGGGGSHNIVNKQSSQQPPSSQPQQQDIVLIYEDCEHERRRSHERFSKPLAFSKNRLFSSHKCKRAKARLCMSTPSVRPKFKPEVPSDTSSATVNPQLSNKDETNSSIIGQSGVEFFIGEPDVSESSVTVAGFLQLHADDEIKKDRNRSPSPINTLSTNRDDLFSPDLDLTTLHEQVDCSEPLLSCANHQINENTETLPGLSVASNRLLSSPRNSIIATHRIYLDKDVPQSTIGLMETKPQNPMELRLQKVVKHINSLKKKIKKYEAEFESRNGYKVSHADKMNDKNVRKLYQDLNKMKKEQKQLTDFCPGLDSVVGIEDEEKCGSKNLQDTLNEIEKRLSQKRETSNRPASIEQMSNDELSEEKIAVQKALLYLESIHGRPDSKEDRNLVRPIYDRYRNLKRLISKATQAGNAVGNELATIHEDETMNFIRTFPTPINEIDSEKSSSVFTSTDSSDTDTSIGENLHSLTKIELIEQHRLLTEEKKELRRAIKTFEMEFQKKTGKMILKEDKAPMEQVYATYKKVKAKLKLLDALVGKQL